MRRVISFLLASVLLLTLVPVAFAETPDDAETPEYTTEPIPESTETEQAETPSAAPTAMTEPEQNDEPAETGNSDEGSPSETPEPTEEPNDTEPVDPEQSQAPVTEPAEPQGEQTPSPDLIEPEPQDSEPATVNPTEVPSPEPTPEATEPPEQTVSITFGAQKLDTATWELSDSDALYSTYAQQIFNRGSARKKLQAAGSRLTGPDAIIYAKLSSEIEKVAAGELTSTVFSIAVDQLGLEQLSWTAEELQVSQLTDENGITAEALSALQTRFSYDLQLIVSTLLANHPYSLYWFDKTAGIATSGYTVRCEFDENRNAYVLTVVGEIRFYFSVSKDYSAGEYEVDPKFGHSVKAASEAAKQIVSKYASKSDEQKLKGYCREICNLVSYNNTAAGESYGNPWQLIWVFDEDDTTNVVCEGYAKAFQYLCDLSSFSSGVGCITVTGTASGSTASGAHMWNIVTMEDGNRYLVDVTNCDAISTEQLFLAGADGDVDSGYSCFAHGTKVTYRYSSDAKRLYTVEELTLCDHAYLVGASTATPTATPSATPTQSYAPTETPIPTTVPSPTETTVRILQFPADALPSGASVDVDGVTYPVTNGNQVVLPLSASATVVTEYTYQNASAQDVHISYPTSMRVWIVETANGVLTAKRMTAFDNLLSYAGSSIRITGTKGIRMITGIPTEKKKQLVGKGISGYTLEEYGTVVGWDSELMGASLTNQSSAAKKAYAYRKGKADPVFRTANGMTQYTNVLVGFTDDQCIPDLAMRPYLILSDAKGNAITLYGGTVHRSIGYIAYQNRSAFRPGTEAYAYIWSIIHHVYGNQYDAEYRK